jgi:putative serine protease PepD
VTTYWNDSPSTPPTTDADLCATWAPADPTAPHQHTDPSAPAPSPGGPTGGAAYASPQYAAPTPPPPPPRTSPSPSRGGGARVALVAVAMTALVGAGFVGRGLVEDTNGATPFSSNPISSTPAVTSNQPSTPLLPGTDEEPVKAVAKALGPSVVVIKTSEGLGSGVIYDTGGLIITNAHVVGQESEVQVTLNDGRTLEGTVVGADAPSDIAVVRVQPPSGGLTAARLAGQSPEVGDLVVALGSPFGFDGTITSGIISAVNRPVRGENGTTENMLQTDAAINPGNSGGALANRRAELVGIPSQIYSESGSSAGIGFAIPIDRAKSVADRLVGGQPVGRGRLGVDAGDTSDGTAGALVRGITSGGAADQAGLQQGDVVTAVNGTAIKTGSELAGAIASHQPGESVTLTVTRDGQSRQVSVTLGTADSTPTNPSGRSQTPRTR